MEQNQEPKVTVKVKKKHAIFPAWMKKKSFIFGVSIGLFIVSFFAICLIDIDNIVRPKWLEIDFFKQLLTVFGLKPFNVSMTTYFIYFFLWGAFFIFLYFRMFYKSWWGRKTDNIQAKYLREPTEHEKKVFTWKYVMLAIGIYAVCVAATLLYFFLSGNMYKLNWSNVPAQLLNLLQTTAILLVLILIIPILFLALWIVLRCAGFILGLALGDASKRYMQSEDYQRHMAAAMEAAADHANFNSGNQGNANINAGQNGVIYVKSSGDANAPQQDILFPALTRIDDNWAKKYEDEAADKEAKEKEKQEREAKRAEFTAKNQPIPPEYMEPAPAVNPNARPPMDYEQFRVLAYEFQSYLCHQKYYFPINTIRAFIAGLASARLILLEGLSGTGKSTLPRVFLEYVGGQAYFFPVQATWRDRSDVTGYYSDFTGQFKETELLKHLYEASYTPETVNLMVLDEMNISRVEYYFADFLSIYEYPSDRWVVPLMQIKPGTKLPLYIEEGKVRIQKNTWFVGTINIDDSTFTVTDKVYDRAIVIDFNKLNLPFESKYRFDPHPITMDEFNAMFEQAKAKPENNLNSTERKKFMDLCAFVGDTFDVQFGNRIMNQIDNFLPVFVGLGGTKVAALDIMFARKVLRKLDGKYESYIRDGLYKLTRYLRTAYGKGSFPETEALIEKFLKKLS